MNGWFFDMGMCAIKGPLVTSSPAEGDGETTPRSTASSSSSHDSPMSQELSAAEEANHFGQGGALWQRTIPKGRRCKPLSFSGIISYDESGNPLPILRDEERLGSTEELD